MMALFERFHACRAQQAFLVTIKRDGDARRRPNQIGPDQCVRAEITHFYAGCPAAKQRAGVTNPFEFVQSLTVYAPFFLSCRTFEREIRPVSTLDVFRRVHIVANNACYLRHVRLSVYISVAPIGRIRVKFGIWDFGIPDLVNVGIPGTLHNDVSTFRFCRLH